MSHTIGHNCGKRHLQKALELSERRAAEREEIRKEILGQLNDIIQERDEAGYFMYLARIASNGEFAY